ncbi:MAG: hypothetical protein ACK4NS_08025 [Saprospiraceae bacterium]
MKNAASILLASLILLQSFGRAWVYLSFKINQDQIARTLCVNRFKPEKLCSGKCVLQQRLQVEDRKDDKELPQKLKDRIEASYCLDELILALPDAACLTVGQAKIFAYPIPFTVAFVKGVFRPPNSMASLWS